MSQILFGFGKIILELKTPPHWRTSIARSTQLSACDRFELGLWVNFGQ